MVVELRADLAYQGETLQIIDAAGRHLLMADSKSLTAAALPFVEVTTEVSVAVKATLIFCPCRREHSHSSRDHCYKLTDNGHAASGTAYIFGGLTRYTPRSERQPRILKTSDGKTRNIWKMSRKWMKNEKWKDGKIRNDASRRGTVLGHASSITCHLVLDILQHITGLTDDELRSKREFRARGGQGQRLGRTL